MNFTRIGAIVLAAALIAGTRSHAEQANAVAITVKGHQFQPAQIHAAANHPLSIRINPRHSGRAINAAREIR
jgi:hypothetical protein